MGVPAARCALSDRGSGARGQQPGCCGDGESHYRKKLPAELANRRVPPISHFLLPAGGGGVEIAEQRSQLIDLVLNDLFDAIYPTVQEVGSLEDALAHGRENLAATAKRVGKILAT